MSLLPTPESHFNLVEVRDPTNVGWEDYKNYRFVEYYLKSALSFKIPISLTLIHNVINEESLARFEDRIKNTQWTYGWVPLNSTDYPDKIGELKTKGFIGKKRSFIVGAISQQEIGTGGHDLYFLLCKLIIGNSMCIKSDKTKDKKINQKKIPPFYNSYKLLTQDNMSVALISKDATGKGLSFQYELFKNNYICPLYVIKFLPIKDTIQKELDNFFCCKCRQKEAEVFCLVCEAYYDRDCYNVKHKAKGKIELSHGPWQELKHKQKQGFCSEHETREAEYYCLTCKRPVCSRCKIIVNQKANAHANHQVRDIFLAYEEETPNFFLADEIRKRAVLQLQRIKETVKALIEKQVLIEKEIDHEFREENDSIQSLTKEAKLKHFSVIAELNEMKKHLVNMDNYFHKCEGAMLEANLKPEAIWIKDNYEEVITDMFSNFDSIKLDYKVTPESFNEIKQTELKITKKIDAEREYFGIDTDEEIDKEDNYEYAHGMTKYIVSLKEEKDEAQKRKEKQAKDKQKQDFGEAKDPLKYVLEERIIDKQKEITVQELQKEVSMLVESKKDISQIDLNQNNASNNNLKDYNDNSE